jgi:hypothetical protein
MRLYTEASLAPAAKDKLTAEDVPPRSMGGHPLVLTCERCNTKAGCTIDVAAVEVERSLSFHAGTGVLDGFIRLGPNTTPATIALQQGTAVVTLKRRSPEAVAIMRELEAGPVEPIYLTGSLRAPDDPLALICYLKSAYLAAFALFGYNYAFSVGLELVRRQIQEPRVKHIPLFCARLPDHHRDLSPRLCALPASGAIPWCWGVIISPYLVFLPVQSAEVLYAKIAEAKGTSFMFSIRNAVWPDEPRFTYARFLPVTKLPFPGGAKLVPLRSD